MFNTQHLKMREPKCLRSPFSFASRNVQTSLYHLDKESISRSKLDSPPVEPSSELVQITPTIKRRLFLAKSWLSAKVLAGFALAITSSAIVGFFGTKDLIANGGATAFLGCTAFCYVLFSKFRSWHYLKNDGLKAFGPCKNDREILSRSLDKLRLAANKPEVKLVLSRSKILKVAGAWDRITSKDHIFINLEDSKNLNSRQIEGIMAHELSHLDRWYSKIHILEKYATSVASVAGFWSLTGGIQAGFGGSGFFGTIGSWSGAFFSAACIMTIFSFANHLLTSFSSRSNELKTDLRAIELTKDPEALITALDKVHRQHVDRNNKFMNLEFLLTHPHPDKRAQVMRSVFKKD